MKTTKFWIMLLVTLLCTGFAACGDDDDDVVTNSADIPFYQAPSRNDLIDDGPWKLKEMKDVYDDQGFLIGTKHDYHEMSFNYDGTGWERTHGYLSTYRGPENEYDTGQQEFEFKYKTSEDSKNKEDVYGTLVITRNGTSRTIIVTLNNSPSWSQHYSLCFDSIAYEGKEYPHSNPVDPVNPDTTSNNPSNHPDTLTTIDGYEFVDLGLSVKWAAKNLSGYYQYGNPTANDFKTEYSLPQYSIGGTSEDPAYANMSNKWRLPTRTEMQELVNDCTWEYTGNSFKVTGSNGNSILLPLDGAYPLGNESSLLYYGYQCWLMTSTLDGGGNPRPYILKASYINSYTSPTVNVTTSEAYRISGMSVRGVSTADPDVRNK